MSELSIFFDIAKYLIWIVFFGAIFFMVFRFIKLDSVKKGIQMLRGEKEQSTADKRGFNELIRNFTLEPSSQPCENGMCSGKVSAPDHGSLVRNPEDGRRLIVCAECAPAYVKTGWIPEMTWGEPFKTMSAISLIAGGGSLLALIPLKVFLAPPVSFNVFIVLIRLAIWTIGVLIVVWILGREQNE